MTEWCNVTPFVRVYDTVLEWCAAENKFKTMCAFFQYIPCLQQHMTMSFLIV